LESVLCACQYHQKRRLAHLFGIHDPIKLQQIFGSGLDFRRAHFHLDRAPSTVGKLNYGVDFESAFVPVVINIAVDAIGIYPQISDAERFKQKIDDKRQLFDSKA
jgi:hypothetical protein